MKNYSFSLTICVLFFLFFENPELSCQNLESFFGGIKNRIQQKEWVKISGGIRATTLGNFMHGIDRRADPFSFRLNANLNFDILGIKAPFSASFSDGNKVYKLPSYAFYGISPSYKWIKLHLGDRSMEFSPYTLSGHNFFGAGMEMSPGKFRFSAMKGKLKRAVAEDLNHLQNIEPSFTRSGWGIKAGYESDHNMLEFILFKSKDDPLSIPVPTEKTDLHPQENTVLGLKAKQTIGKLISLDIDYGFSGLTRNSNSPVLESLQKDFIKTMGGLFQPKTSSGFYHAIKSNLGVNTNFGQVGFNYERIDPGYKTLGTLFFNHDVENFTLNTSISLFKNKATLSGNFGLQRNNLGKLEHHTNKRLIGSLNMGIQAGERLNFNLSWSNTSNTSRLRALTLPGLNVDSLILVQTNSSASLNGTFNLSKRKERQSTISGMFSYQQASSIENDEVNEYQSTAYYMGTLSHIYSLQASGLSINSSFLVNYGQIPGLNILTYAPSMAVSKKVLNEQLNLTASFAFSTILSNGLNTNKILNVQLSGGIKLFEKQQLNAGFSYVNNKSNAADQAYRAFRELNGNLSYSWSF